MSRITKDTARRISVKLTEKKRKHINDLQKVLSDYCYELAKKQIPKDVTIAYSKHKSYFKTCCQIRFIGNGFNYENVSFSPEIPNTESYYISITPNKEVAKEVLKMLDDLKIKRREIENLQTEIENALLSIGTYKRCEIEFNEAFLLLPTKLNNQLIINVSDIRKKL